MASEVVKIILKSGKDQSLRRFHPWVFSGAIKKIHGFPEEGDLVVVYSNKDEFLGKGHFQKGSIAVRILSFKDEPIDESFWYKRILEAYEYRCETGITASKKTNIYRLVNAEGDQLPGLIIDCFNNVFVLQIHSIGVFLNRELIVEALQKIFFERDIVVYDKSSGAIPHKAGLEVQDEYLMGNKPESVFMENGLQFSVDWEAGQKTGFFIDQRENRRLLESMCQNRKVLNLFCYTGGFSVYAIRGGASLVHSVDSSVKAVELTNKNVGLNFPEYTEHKGFVADVFKYLEECKEEYDLIIVDPPAFAKHQNVLANALQGYKRLNRTVIGKAMKGSLIFTFSCSQVVSKENFRKSVFTAAANTGRNIRILHQLTQPADHPVNIYHPEGEYLKGLVLYVD